MIIVNACLWAVIKPKIKEDIKLKVKKWVRTLAKSLFFIGAFIVFGLAGNCDAYPNYPIAKVLIYSMISAVLCLPYLLIFIHEGN